MNDKINEYLKQDIDNPIYMFHGSHLKLETLIPHLSHDSNGTEHNIADAVFLFPSFVKATPYAFMETIIKNSEGMHPDFEIYNHNTFPVMRMSNVNIDEDIIGYIYVFKKDDTMIKDNHKGSYQYKCYHELKPIDVIEICYRDFKDYYEVTRKIL